MGSHFLLCKNRESQFPICGESITKPKNELSLDAMEHDTSTNTVAGLPVVLTETLNTLINFEAQITKFRTFLTKD